MESLWQDLKKFWISQNVKIGRPASMTEIERFESTHQIRLPLDFKSYLLEINGMDDTAWEVDEDLICFWSLRNMKSVAEDDPDWAKKVEHAEEYFIFSDHLIRSHDFALRVSTKKPDSASVYVLYNQPQQIASSFTEYIERYIAGDEEMSFPTLKN